MPEETENKKTALVIHPEMSQDPGECYKKVQEFVNTKSAEDLSLYWGVSPVMAGASRIAQGMQMQMIPITTCLIFWKCTPEQEKSYRTQMSLKLQRS